MSSAAWKDLERRVCRRLGAQRRPSVGRGGWARGSDDDGTAPFAVECKKTARWQLRAAWVKQARDNAKADGRPWLLVIEPTRGRAVAVLDFYVLAQLAEEAGRVQLQDEEGGRMSASEQDVPQPPTEPDEPEPQPDPDEGDGDDDTPPEKA